MAEYLNTGHLTGEFSTVTCQLIHCLNIDRSGYFPSVSFMVEFS